jgi:hypothetical protein
MIVQLKTSQWLFSWRPVNDCSAEDYPQGGGKKSEAGPKDAQGAARVADRWRGGDVVGRQEVETEVTAWSKELN